MIDYDSVLIERVLKELKDDRTTVSTWIDPGEYYFSFDVSTEEKYAHPRINVRTGYLSIRIELMKHRFGPDSSYQVKIRRFSFRSYNRILYHEIRNRMVELYDKRNPSIRNIIEEIKKGNKK